MFIQSISLPDNMTFGYGNNFSPTQNPWWLLISSRIWKLNNFTCTLCFKDLENREGDAWLFINHVSTGIQYLHWKDIIHRDIKPANIVAKSGSESIQWKLVDFGVSKRLNRDSLGATVFGTESPAGTQLYMSPEALGVRTFYKMFDMLIINNIISV